MTQSFLPYGRQHIDDEDVAAVLKTLRSDYLTTGPEVPAFEEALCAAVGAKHAIAVSNGTAALHAACFAAGVGPGDEVIVPAITFVASANCVRYMGAEPVFVDVDPSSGLLQPEAVEAAITDKTKAIIPVHLNGRPVNLRGLQEVARRHKLIVIEDAAHALGATYEDSKIGDQAFTDMSIFSFHPVKHITTAEGGAIMTNDDDMAAKLRMFRDHGLARTAETFLKPSPGPWYYEQHVLGYNLRLSAIQCTLGRIQLQKLGRFITRRLEIAALYDQLFAEVPSIKPASHGPENSVSAYHLYPVLIDYKAVGKERVQVMTELREHKIGTQVHYIPVPSQPYYAARGWEMKDFVGAATYYEGALSLPMYPDLTDEDVRRVVTSLREICNV